MTSHSPTASSERSASPTETCEALAALPSEKLYGDAVVVVIELA